LRADAGAAVAQLAERLAAPVMTTYLGRGLIPPTHPCAVPGTPHAREVGALWDEADVVIGIGSDFDGLMTQNWLMPQPPTLIAINLDEADASKNYAPQITLVGDARDVLEQLLPHVAQRAGIEATRSRLAAIGEALSTSIATEDPDAYRFLEIMERALPADTVVVVDMCIPGYWIGGFRHVPAPRKLAYPLGWGTLGFGFPASIGASLANAGPTVCVTGDGGFLFACGELATVAQEKVPLTIVLVDDGGYGMLRFDQVRVGDEPFGVDLVGPDFEAMARSFGISASTIEGFGPEFESALADSIRSGEPRMIVVTAALNPPPNTSPRWYRRA
jgi:acetolactate synthase-1/2/3 large subunit